VPDMDTPLTDEVISVLLKERPGWSRDGRAIRRDLTFPDFTVAFAFMTKVAFAAERLGHHPDWSNTYNRVTVRISHHDAGGITDRCFALADAVDDAALMIRPG
jgi:4a-hydroxytetrahydrobiopterin dehydratase